MLVLSAAGTGGTGRSVTSANLAYRRALAGDDVCCLDFDFGSPTAAVPFDLPGAAQGVERSGLHTYLLGRVGDAVRIDVWAETESPVLRQDRPVGAGQLVLLPGDRGGGDFVSNRDTTNRCADILLRLYSEFDVLMIDLSAGRSYATDLVLGAISLPELRGIDVRWLVHHRWTRQHLLAASGLVHGKHGILASGEARGLDGRRLRGALRFVRVAVPDPESPPWALLPAHRSSWMRARDQDLSRLASACELGDSVTLGSVPYDPVLAWREQLITDEDWLGSRIANRETAEAFADLAARLTDKTCWGPL
ncbi:SCO2523 family variant P-loop protein [Streptomyces sp. NBC_01198]|uniref:SCO2523 family variant P-loop protein n=1 Tax=Streptomyces sp. NBC_01198 TaxID=2903769 RepID=UPI002E11C876|nr:SCO2523 family variant P-loop protein [Streptomyces sp. NBC_01198]